MSWYQLLSISRERRRMRAEDEDLIRVACPHDGEPYQSGPDGQLHCPFDGYTPEWD